MKLGRQREGRNGPRVGARSGRGRSEATTEATKDVHDAPGGARSRSLQTILVFAGLAGCWASPRVDAVSPPAQQPEVGAEARVEPAEEPVVAVPAKTVNHDATCEGVTTCQGESCCTRILVPAGTYTDRKAGDVRVESFYLDKYEVTVGRVRSWVRGGSPTPYDGELLGHDSGNKPVRWSSTWKVQSETQLRGWERYDTFRTDRDDLPKNFIDWYTASAVCHMAGGRLPTDAEWRYVAVGGEENRTFPWGSDEQTPQRAIYNCMGDGDKSCSLADILPVGSRPLGAGRWGHQDLAGSMFEWTLDAGGTEDVVNRGGGFCYIGGMDRRSKHVRTVENVRKDAPNVTSHMVGARCAFDLDPPRETISRSE